MKTYVAITGASSGIGREAARLFASRGKNIIAIARRKERLEELKKELEATYHIEVIVKVCDLSQSKEVFKLYEDIKTYPIETMINNAGFGHSKTIIEQDLDKVLEMIHLNIEALTILSTLYARDYENVEGSTLINVSSTVGYGVSSRVPAYSSTKFYVSAFSEALYYEMKEKQAKLRVKVLAPAMTATEFSYISSNGKVPKNAQLGGNTVEEMAKFLGELYDSDECLGYIETDDYSFHLSSPQIPHSFTKQTNPNLLKR